MFDLTSMKLLILGLVALIVIGPKDLPIFLRAIGKYVGIIRRQAAEFRSQFDEAMRESELQSLRDEMQAMKRDMKSGVDSVGKSVDSDIASARTDIDNQIRSPSQAPAPPAPEPHPLNGATPHLPADAERAQVADHPKAGT